MNTGPTSRQSQIRADLVAARELIADIDNWTTGFWAIDNTGVDVDPCSARACAWCADGALVRVSNQEWGPRHSELYLALSNASFELFDEGIIEVNDGALEDYGLPETAGSDEYWAAQHAYVLRAFDLAIKRAA